MQYYLIAIFPINIYIFPPTGREKILIPLFKLLKNKNEIKINNNNTIDNCFSFFFF